VELLEKQERARRVFANVNWLRKWKRTAGGVPQRSLDMVSGRRFQPGRLWREP